MHDTPSVAGGVVYAGGQDAYTTAGRKVWISNAPFGTADASPAVTPDSVLLVTIVGNYLWASDARTGRQLFDDETDVISGQPAVVGNTIYTGGYWNVFAFRP